jgi:ParB family chromosome partitioning protein
MTAKKKRGLGRGLDALIPVVETGLQTVPISDLRPNRMQPRSAFDETGLEELAESIRVQGVVQPIVVTARDKGYVIVAGERRWRAAKRADLQEVPVVVREVVNEQEMLELALVENLQRADLNVLEEAEGYHTLTRKYGLSQEDVGRKTGKSRATVANALRLLNLPATIQVFLREGRLTAGQARPLLSISGETRQIELAERAVKEGLSARAIEALAAAGKQRQKKDAKKKQDPNTEAAAERLTRRLQTKVEIRRRGRGGVVQVHYHSEEELMRLYELMMGKGGGS